LSIGPAGGATTVDGNLDDWPEDALTILVPPDRLVTGEPPTSPDDLGAKVRLCHSEDALFVAATVTDDIVRHESSRSWEGDGIVILFRFSAGTPSQPPERYDLVLNYASGTPDGGGAWGAVLEDRTARYGPDDKPSAPGTCAAIYSDSGYVLEAAIPIDDLGRYGFRPGVGGIGLGLSVYDGDHRPDGPSSRETAISWNQQSDLYDPVDAVVVQWEAVRVR
jgi:hypothetical protein